MKRINKILFVLVVALIGFVGMKNVNADTIYSPDATCGDFPKDGDALITSCSSSGEESDLFDVTVMTWYKGDLYGSSTTAPGESVGTTGVYESGYKYYLELKFAPKAGNEIANETNFNIIGLYDGTIMDVTQNGEYIVIFEYTVHHIVHFETYGGTSIDDIVVTDWCSFDMPDDPVKDGYTFLGWYEDPNFEYNYWGSCVDESFTLYAKYVETSKIIKNINVTLLGPTIGQLITSSSYTDPEWGAVIYEQNPRPTATIANDVHYSVDSTAWVNGLCDEANEVYLCDEFFEGEIESDTYYYAAIGIEANESYALDSDVTIKVNGEKPDEVFAVYESSYTRFIAKIKGEGNTTTSHGYLSDYDFGTSTVGYGWIDNKPISFTISDNYEVDPDRLTSSISGPDYDKFNVSVMTNYAVMEGPGTWTNNSPVVVQPITGLEPGTYKATLTLKYDADNDGVHEVEFDSANLTFKVIDNIKYINRIDITSNTTSAYVGELPSFTVSTTTDHITIQEFGSNTNWSQNYLGEQTSWHGFGTGPVVAKLGDTHYALGLCVQHNEGYDFDDNVAIYFNGKEITNQGFTWFNTSFDWGGYLYIDLGVAKKIDISKAKVTGIVDKVYNGYYQKQKNIKVTLNGKTLKEGTDYKISHYGNKNVGTAKVTITGIGDYEGSIVKTFKVTKANNTLKIVTYKKSVLYSKVKSSSQVVKPITIVKRQGTMSYEKLSGSKYLTVNKTTGKVTVKKGTKKGTYTAKIKVKAAGNSNYKSAWKSVTVTITVK